MAHNVGKSRSCKGEIGFNALADGNGWQWKGSAFTADISLEHE